MVFCKPICKSSFRCILWIGSGGKKYESISPDFSNFLSQSALCIKSDKENSTKTCKIAYPSLSSLTFQIWLEKMRASTVWKSALQVCRNVYFFDLWLFAFVVTADSTRRSGFAEWIYVRDHFSGLEALSFAQTLPPLFSSFFSLPSAAQPRSLAENH